MYVQDSGYHHLLGSDGNFSTSRIQILSSLTVLHSAANSSPDVCSLALWTTFAFYRHHVLSVWPEANYWTTLLLSCQQYIPQPSQWGHCKLIQECTGDPHTLPRLCCRHSQRSAPSADLRPPRSATSQRTPAPAALQSTSESIAKGTRKGPRYQPTAMNAQCTEH